MRSLPYDYQTNGLGERTNQTITKLIQYLCCKSKRGAEWWLHIPKALEIYSYTWLSSVECALLEAWHKQPTYWKQLRQHAYENKLNHVLMCSSKPKVFEVLTIVWVFRTKEYD